mgnify:CR=1 FL=1
MKNFPRFRKLIFIIAILITLTCVADAFAKKGKTKARFYDFSDQLIDGEIRKPAALWLGSRTRAKFGKLLLLKKSFRNALIMSGKEPILK